MITAGVDCGSKNVRVVILKDGEILAKAIVPAGMDAAAAAQEAYEQALESIGGKDFECKHVLVMIAQ